MSAYSDGEIMHRYGSEVWLKGHIPEEDAAYIIAAENCAELAVEIVSHRHTYARYVPGYNDDGEIGYYMPCAKGRGTFPLTIAFYNETDEPIDRCSHPEGAHGLRLWNSHRMRGHRWH